MIINRIYETQKLVPFLVGLRTYQHPCINRYTIIDNRQLQDWVT